MEKFIYLENANFAATVCDKDGVVLYQNARARKRDGSVVGKNLFNCHNKMSQEIIHRLITNGESNTYETIKHNKRHLLYQTPWYEEPGGEVAGLIEVSIDLPSTYPVYNRDAPKNEK